MIVKEFYRTRKDGAKLFKTYSDKGMYIQKVGTQEVYAVAIDVENTPYAYKETKTNIKKEELSYEN